MLGKSYLAFRSLYATIYIQCACISSPKLAYSSRMDTSSSLPRPQACLLPNQSLGGGANESVIAQIEAIFEGIVDGFLGSEHTHSIPIRVKTRTNGSRTSTTMDGNISYNIRLVKYPGRTAQEAWRFGTLFISYL